MSESDFDSPGFEHLRLYHNMSILYFKLLALNYQKEFCPLYKCHPIHKYYFSVQNRNHSDQQYLFTCLCAWLIKDKCQMNLEITPEEYEDLDHTVNIINEALELLLEHDGTTKGRKNSRNSFRFPVARLKLGFGSEAILALNILADRALELGYESGYISNKPIELTFHEKLNQQNNGLVSETSKSITIGQPLVGGGLTTRPLGNYKIDDESLLFNDTTTTDRATYYGSKLSSSYVTSPTKTADWYKRVERMASLLNNASEKIYKTGSKAESWSFSIDKLKSTKQAIQEFLYKFEPVLDAIPARINKQMDTINERERVIQTNLSPKIGNFLKVWREYSGKLARNEALQREVDAKMNTFEMYKAEVKDIHHKIECRVLELNDGSKLRELESTIARLEKENCEFDLKIGLLLSVYCEVHSSLVREYEEIP